MLAARMETLVLRDVTGCVPAKPRGAIPATLDHRDTLGRHDLL